ncbi:TIGR03943 family putative permease subunit [Streptomyces sp. BE303]|uniref:TIGR03943 family putative permease subunit n=1 Tax=Streptomyces sp. BE303 TaxID=3002528 RepID=UPI002E78EEDC|nr:TIGR03943 family protein [Streptomyces sp. BE303]MED7947461.1 TIGR03943 family protein [Streptomyces sp. BE303]
MNAPGRTLRARVRGLAPSLLLALVGTALLRITVGSDVFLQYVKEELRIPLVATGVILLALGIAGTAVRLTERRREPVLEFRRDAEGNAQWHRPASGHDHTGRDGTGGGDDPGHEHAHGHSHEHGPRVAWLLTVPAVLLLCFTPPALGSFTASREGTDAAVDAAAYVALPDPQPAVAAAVNVPTPMALAEFIARSRDPRQGLADRPVRLTGFVTPGTAPGEWYLNRLVASCCAADARRLRILVQAEGPTPATDSWVELTGVWHPTPDASATAAPRLDAREQHGVPQPRAPYRDTPPSSES